MLRASLGKRKRASSPSDTHRNRSMRLYDGLQPGSQPDDIPDDTSEPMSDSGHDDPPEYTRDPPEYTMASAGEEADGSIDFGPFSDDEDRDETEEARVTEHEQNTVLDRARSSSIRSDSTETSVSDTSDGLNEVRNDHGAVNIQEEHEQDTVPGRARSISISSDGTETTFFDANEQPNEIQDDDQPNEIQSDDETNEVHNNVGTGEVQGDEGASDYGASEGKSDSTSDVRSTDTDTDSEGGLDSEDVDVGQAFEDVEEIEDGDKYLAMTDEDNFDEQTNNGHDAACTGSPGRSTPSNASDDEDEVAWRRRQEARAGACTGPIDLSSDENEDFPTANMAKARKSKHVAKAKLPKNVEDHMRLHEKAKALRPGSIAGKDRYWIGVLDPSVGPTAIRKDKDFMWMKGHGGTTIRTVREIYKSQTALDYEFRLEIQGTFPDDKDVMRELDLMNDQHIIFRVVEKRNVVELE